MPLPGDPPPASRTGSLRVLVAAGLVVVLAGACGSPRQGSRSLVAHAEAAGGGEACPGADAGGGSPAPGSPRRVTRGHSLRSAVVTCPGVVLRLPLEGRGGATLDLALGRVGGGEEDAGGDP